MKGTAFFKTRREPDSIKTIFWPVYSIDGFLSFDNCQQNAITTRVIKPTYRASLLYVLVVSWKLFFRTHNNKKSSVKV